MFVLKIIIAGNECFDNPVDDMKRNILILNINIPVFSVNCESMILVDFFCHITVPKNICLTLTLFSVTLILHLCVHTSPKCGLCFTLIFATICFGCTAPFADLWDE